MYRSCDRPDRLSQRTCASVHVYIALTMECRFKLSKLLPPQSQPIIPSCGCDIAKVAVQEKGLCMTAQYASPLEMSFLLPPICLLRVACSGHPTSLHGTGTRMHLLCQQMHQQSPLTLNHSRNTNVAVVKANALHHLGNTVVAPVRAFETASAPVPGRSGRAAEGLQSASLIPQCWMVMMTM